MKKVPLGKTGELISVIGQGTWGINRFRSSQYYTQWKTALHTGIELGMDHIDTAEAYGWGKAEEIVGEIVTEYNRDDLFITSKLFPIHFTYNRMKKAAYKSLDRLNLKYFDLYLIHWPNPLVSIKKQMKVLESLATEGKTRYIGVSNFSVNQFKKAQTVLKKTELVTNQVRAHIAAQTHIHESLPYYQEHGITMTAYSPLGHRGFTNLKGDLKESLDHLAKIHNATIQQIAIAWLINLQNVITIPKAFTIEHITANAAAADITLSKKEINLLAENPLL
ncbi:MAG: aldo/keto reductase [Candidatus Methanofastidiosia archaeon]|jgi:diketogulonate reductase-like aldo/keto reductase